MKPVRVLIIGGGVAGLSAGCYALANGMHCTIIEHSSALGGVCTTWKRESYTIDGCIQWLLGGHFAELYRELGILPQVELKTLEHFVTYRNARTGLSIDVTRDLGALKRALVAIAPLDEIEIDRLLRAADRLAAMDPHVQQPAELVTLGTKTERVWTVHRELGELVHFRKPLSVYAAEHLKSPMLRGFLRSLTLDDTPVFLAAFILGYLERGMLSRPVGGTARFRDALVQQFVQLGGKALLETTVQEVLVEANAVRGVLLTDGTKLEADVVICTSSAPEAMLQLLEGRFYTSRMQRRFQEWPMFEPIVLASYGIASPLTELPPRLYIDETAEVRVGGVPNDRLYLRIFNDEPSVAPEGHTVVQAMLSTDYEYWATRRDSYEADKNALGLEVLHRLEAHLPDLRGNVRMTDVATPITYWRNTRSWRGAYEGWLPTQKALAHHVDQRLSQLAGFYMAGQWVEPGGGVPVALMSGRHAVQLLCSDRKVPFVLPSLRSDGVQLPA